MSYFSIVAVIVFLIALLLVAKVADGEEMDGRDEE